MFEKDAEEYIDKLTENWTDGAYSFSVEEMRQAILHFAEFGYNKAKAEANDIIDELLINGYDESTRRKALDFLYPDKEV